ncbi:tripartite motif-containing protein 14-like [Lampetra planeri]
MDGCSPTLDTNSAHDRLQISSDLRTVTVSRVSQGHLHHPHRFDYWDQALCRESFSSGQHYWEVDMGCMEPPRRVGVHLDWDGGLLSFYGADSMTLLHSFHQTFVQPRHPGLLVGYKVGD